MCATKEFIAINSVRVPKHYSAEIKVRKISWVAKKKYLKRSKIMKLNAYYWLIWKHDIVGT